MFQGLVLLDGGYSTAWHTTTRGTATLFRRLVFADRFLLYAQVVRHVLARHDPLRCGVSQRREGHDSQRAVHFRGNELLGLVAVGGVKVRLVAIKPTTINDNKIANSPMIKPLLGDFCGITERGAGQHYWKIWALLGQVGLLGRSWKSIDRTEYGGLDRHPEKMTPNITCAKPHLQSHQISCVLCVLRRERPRTTT